MVREECEIQLRSAAPFLLLCCSLFYTLLLLFCYPAAPTLKNTSCAWGTLPLTIYSLLLLPAWLTIIINLIQYVLITLESPPHLDNPAAKTTHCCLKSPPGNHDRHLAPWPLSATLSNTKWFYLLMYTIIISIVFSIANIVVNDKPILSMLLYNSFDTDVVLSLYFMPWE